MAFGKQDKAQVDVEEPLIVAKRHVEGRFGYDVVSIIPYSQNQVKTFRNYQI